MISTYHTAEPTAAMLARLSMPEPNSGCHLWLGKIGTGDYAYIAYREGKKRLHRKAATVALELAGSPRPEGMEVSHKCNNRACVNPDHLVWETHGDNMQRRTLFPTREFCKQGHLLEGLKRAANGGCPICEKTRLAAWREKHPTANRDYFIANRERINAQRRERRRNPK